MLNYNNKQKELLSDVPVNLSADLLHVIQILDYRNQKDVANILNESRKDLLFYNNSVNLTDEYDLADDDYGVPAFDKYKKGNKDQQLIDVRISTELLNERLNYDDKGFVNTQIPFAYARVNNLSNNSVNNNYTLKDKINYYKKRVTGNYNGKKLSDGQVNHARKFLKMNGVNYE